jgi:hypothetical protein
MAEYEIEKIRMGGLFSPKTKVGYEIKFERPALGGEVKSISMYNLKDGTPLGKLEYTRSGTRAKLNSFAVNDWSTIKYAESLLRRFIRHMRKQNVAVIDAEVYGVDDKTHYKLSIFKRYGFKVEAGGDLTGYQQYHLRLVLR